MDDIHRLPDESVPQFAKRMSDLVRLIQGIVQSHAGMGRDMDEVLDELDFIFEHAADAEWHECWELRAEIEHIIARTTDLNRLRRIRYFAQEMSQ